MTDDPAVSPSYAAVMGERAERAYMPVESTFMGFLGGEFERLPDDGLQHTVTVTDRLKQPMGIVHGGIYAAIAESVASMGAVHAVGLSGPDAPPLVVMGQSNNTSFLRPVTEGTIRAVGTIRHRGRTTMLWQVDMFDSHDRLSAVSQVTMAIRPQRTP